MSVPGIGLAAEDAALTFFEQAPSTGGWAVVRPVAYATRLQPSLLLGILATALTAPQAYASNGMPFEAAAFRAAQAAGKTIVIEITAKWCGPCQRQRPVVAKMLEKPEFAHLTPAESRAG